MEDANHKGSLIIQDVTLGDTDNYTCRVNYIDPDSQDVIKRTFVHFVKGKNKLVLNFYEVVLLILSLFALKYFFYFRLVLTISA